MDEQRFGERFEKAAYKVLEILFQSWGYRIDYMKRQHAGPQHGFDIFYRISGDRSAGSVTSLNIYVECKSSHTYSYIPLHKLTHKITQMNWAGYTHKDVHLFFSPTVGVKEKNMDLGVEAEEYPFIVIDWLRKNSAPNRIMELFFTCRDSNEAVKEYCEFLANEEVFKKDFSSSYTFAEIAAELRESFEHHINLYYTRSRGNDFHLFNNIFLKQVRNKTNSKYLMDYYTRIDSNPQRILEVVANDFHIPIEGPLVVVDDKTGKEEEKTIHDLLMESVDNCFTLIKILARGGEGKSTFLYQLAWQYYETFNVFYLEKLDERVIKEIRRAVIRLNKKIPLLLLLDNADKHVEDLIDYGRKLHTAFIDDSLVFVLAERDFRYEHMEDIKNFESCFEELRTVKYITPVMNKERISMKFLEMIKKDNGGITERDDARCRDIYMDQRTSLAESAFKVIRYLKTGGKIRYDFDWGDWDKFIKRHSYYSCLDNLFLTVAIFYQFGINITDTFYARGDMDVRIKLNDALDTNDNLPIYKIDGLLFLRHEEIAKWYFDDEKKGAGRCESAIILFKEFFKVLSDDDSRYLLIKTYRNRMYLKSFLKDLLDSDRVEMLLEDYITRVPDDLKGRTELGKIYINKKKWIEAEKVLKEAIEINEEDVPARTELGRVYQRMEKWAEAEKVLKEANDIDDKHIHSRTELGRVYQRMKKWGEAEKVLKKAIEIDEENVPARTELGRVYQGMEKWGEAEKVLKKAIEIDEEDVPARTELGRVYQQLKKFVEAENVLKEVIDIDDKHIHSRTELGRVYQRMKKFVEAEKVLKEVINIDDKHIHSRTELGRVYQRMKNWGEAEKVLKEAIGIDERNLHPRTELGRVYRRMKNWGEAEKVLKEAISIDEENVYPRTELGRVYRQMKNWGEAEKVLKEAISIDKKNVHPRAELGRVYRWMKNWSEAEKVLKEAISIDEENVYPRTELGRVYQQMKKWDEAEKVLNEVLSIKPKYKHACIQLGILYRLSGRFKDSEKILKEVLEIDKDNFFALKELRKLKYR